MVNYQDLYRDIIIAQIIPLVFAIQICGTIRKKILPTFCSFL